ncbi:MAG TPA: DUF427 domain-containing protein [Pseudonocardia sp.]
MTRTVKIPDATHPITVRPTDARVRVTVDGQQVADTQRALSLAESNYPVVQYIPLADVDTTVLRPSDTTTYCPYKGDASYYSVQTSDGATHDDVIWTYEHPYAAVAQIEGHVAFYADRAELSIDS